MIIIEKNSGKFLFATDSEYECSENEMICPVNMTDFFVNPYFDFQNNKFYETATPEEVEQYKLDFFIE